MRHLTLASAALALVFLGGALPAAAQTPRDSSTSSQGQAVQEKYKLTPSQEQNMMQTLRNEQTQNSPSGFDGRVGSKVPDSMSMRQLPNEAAAHAPQTKGLLFVRLPDRVLLIDPDEKAVVEIVADRATTGSGGSGQPGGDTQRQPGAGSR
jgi:hypothetical protein